MKNKIDIFFKKINHEYLLSQIIFEVKEYLSNHPEQEIMEIYSHIVLEKKEMEKYKIKEVRLTYEDINRLIKEIKKIFILELQKKIEVYYEIELELEYIKKYLEKNKKIEKEFYLFFIEQMKGNRENIKLLKDNLIINLKKYCNYTS